MEVKSEEKKLTIKEIVSSIEHAFHEADHNSSYEDEYWFATKPERGLIIVNPRHFDLYKKEDIEEELLKKFPKDRYKVSITPSMIMFHKRVAM